MAKSLTKKIKKKLGCCCFQQQLLTYLKVIRNIFFPLKMNKNNKLK